MKELNIKIENLTEAQTIAVEEMLARREIYNSIKAIVGLFIPVKWGDNRFGFTISIGHIGIGWIMIIVALIIKLI